METTIARGRPAARSATARIGACFPRASTESTTIAHGKTPAGHRAVGLWLVVFLASLALLQTVSLAIANGSRAQAEALVDEGMAVGDNSDKEAELYRRAIEIDPSYASAHFNLAFVLQAQGRLEEAASSYRNVIHHDPERAAAYYNLATILDHVRQGAAVLEVRSLLNRYTELAEGNEEEAESLALAKDRILEIERQIAGLKNAEVKGSYTAEEITERLTKSFRRGKSPYAGPRIPVRILFDFDSDRIRPESIPQLESIAKAVKDRRLSGTTIMMEGHTDSIGFSSYNKGLSERRANAVIAYLVDRLGVPRDALLARGLGEDRPIRPNDTDQNRAQNRRVELVNWGEWKTIVQEVRESKRRSEGDLLFLEGGGLE